MGQRLAGQLPSTEIDPESTSESATIAVRCRRVGLVGRRRVPWRTAAISGL
jgi:hypothetical protein